MADRVTGVELPRQLYTACGECQTSISSGIFKIQGLPRRATSECVISTLAARGAPRTEAEAAHRLWCPADYLGEIASAGHTPYPKLRVRAMPPTKIYGSEGSDTSLREVTDT